ncbi:MAG: M1 family metallopeptidase [Ignavibacteria bacterium]|nr:M1 family metallopeptidase [Ignavibacteria bacterium]
MPRSWITTAEYTLFILTLIALSAFIGLPPGDHIDLQESHTGDTAEKSPPDRSWEHYLVLPTQSERIANYRMDVRLDTQTNIISGWLILEWKNTTGRLQRDFPFHLYHNAWKNNRSTYAKESGWHLRRSAMTDDEYGYTNVKSVKLLDDVNEIDITPSFVYIQPDDGNKDDQTVFQVTTPRAIPPGAAARFKIDFETKQPLPISRTGVIRDYHFVAQWFPKIGVWWSGQWNCHQFHSNTEFFADYGVYDVTITLPARYVVGATGGFPEWERDNGDGTKTLNFHQADVHDFAWLASPHLVRTVRTFRHVEPDPGEPLDYHHPLKEVTVILLTQPHHDNTIERYFDATFKSLQYYGEWYGEYPYETVTVVDPANGSRSGGMEYPTLFTGGTTMFAPKEQPSPESVTVHEFGHQFWYGLIGNNEFEEAWLDEGFNSYSQARVMERAWKPFKIVQYFFGGDGAGTSVGIPYVFRDIDQQRYSTGNLQVRELGTYDVMARKGWEYYKTYSLNSYTKPAMSLMMLENYLGEETMYRIMRTYHHRYRYKHPTTQDFIRTVHEVTGKDMNWFFENTWFSSGLFDYSIDALENRRIPPPMGIFSHNDRSTDASISLSGRYESIVIVRRIGEAVAPVDVKIVFENGETVREEWDGQYRWKKYTYVRESPVKYAIVDPERKLVLDVNYNNNSRVAREGRFRSLAARKIASKWMFWVQNSLEFGSFWH